MRRIAASIIAMAAGWAVMNMVLFLLFLAGGKIPLNAAGMIDSLRASSPWLMITALVVMGAWLVVYLPVFALMPRRSRFWNWSVCVPCGTVVGALVPFGILALPQVIRGDNLLILPYLLLPATVGTVAAAVGRWLVDWSRDYRDLPGYYGFNSTSARLGAGNL